MIIKRKNIACLLITPQKEFLLIQRNSKDDSLPGFWELPSGGIDEGEKLEKCVQRETIEETGIDISKHDIKEVDSERYQFKKENGDIKDVVETTFAVNIDKKIEVKLSEEHVDYQWISLKQLDNVFDDKDDLIYRRIHRIFKKEKLN